MSKQKESGSMSSRYFKRFIKKRLRDKKKVEKK